MSLNTLIDQIDTLVTNSAPLSLVKSRLLSLREQAEALDQRVHLLESEAQQSVPESAYKEALAEKEDLRKDRDFFRQKADESEKAMAKVLEYRAAGKWDWQRGAHIAEFACDGSVKSSNGDTGTWRWGDSINRLLVVVWSSGYEDSMTMSEDFLHLVGTNHQGASVYAKKKV